LQSVPGSSSPDRTGSQIASVPLSQNQCRREGRAAVIGYDKASKIAHYALDNDLTLKQAALKLGFVTEDEFDRVVDPAKMVHPYVAKAS
jgi:hypothetical protein